MATKTYGGLSFQDAANVSLAASGGYLSIDDEEAQPMRIFLRKNGPRVKRVLSRYIGILETDEAVEAFENVSSSAGLQSFYMKMLKKAEQGGSSGWGKKGMFFGGRPTRGLIPNFLWGRR